MNPYVTHVGCVDIVLWRNFNTNNDMLTVYIDRDEVIELSMLTMMALVVDDGYKLIGQIVYMRLCHTEAMNDEDVKRYRRVRGIIHKTVLDKVRWWVSEYVDC